VHSLTQPSDSGKWVQVGALVSLDLRAKLERLTREGDRSLSAEIRRVRARPVPAASHSSCEQPAGRRSAADPQAGSGEFELVAVLEEAR
jgi:hypothetical protein